MSELERVAGPIPGPRSRALAATLANVETRGVTYLADDFPVFWASAQGATVTDVDGNRYLDLTSAFGVALTGHANAAVAIAISAQAQRLPHGMGDVHPSDVKVALLQRLAGLAPVDEPRTFLCSSGAESVEFAMKSAMLATGKPDVLAFHGAYHGLSYGALEAGGIEKFRAPWRAQLRNAAAFVDFPDRREPASARRSLDAIEAALAARGSIGAVLAEPIQGRAGVIVPPDGFLRDLRALCDARGVLLVLDEIYTGFGRTGTLFACEREGVRPDMLCVGKALGGGFPISATIVTRRVADAWPASAGEALHTSTYLGNPMGCAAALANLDEIERRDLVAQASERETLVLQQLERLRAANTWIVDVRGRGMLWAIEFDDGATAGAVALRALQMGVMVLQSGLRGESLTIAPPLVIGDDQLARALS
ncbi:MAG: aspartate aminotransferase family protein, partial [Candidatus Eremiobacteraeota bacterium]|nr:aspartate aminotransferase family protein [Candidatus Eremiobacteraeota bacterium]